MAILWQKEANHTRSIGPHRGWQGGGARNQSPTCPIVAYYYYIDLKSCQNSSIASSNICISSSIDSSNIGRSNSSIGSSNPENPAVRDRTIWISLTWRITH